jgi:hypothetical protein
MIITALKRAVNKIDANIHINTSQFLYSDRVRHHNHSILGLSIPTGDPHGLPYF